MDARLIAVVMWWHGMANWRVVTWSIYYYLLLSTSPSCYTSSDLSLFTSCFLHKIYAPHTISQILIEMNLHLLTFFLHPKKYAQVAGELNSTYLHTLHNRLLDFEVAQTLPRGSNVLKSYLLLNLSENINVSHQPSHLLAREATM